MAAVAIINIFAHLAQADEYEFDTIWKKNKAQAVLSLEAALEEALDSIALLQAVKAQTTAKEARIGPSGALEIPLLEASLTN